MRKIPEIKINARTDLSPEVAYLAMLNNVPPMKFAKNKTAIKTGALSITTVDKTISSFFIE